MRHADVLILGGGIAGLSTAWHVARRGDRRVALLEREPAPGRCSSGLNAAILRTIGTDPVLNEITCHGGEFLRHPPAGFAPVPLLDECGFLLVADGDSAPPLRAALAGDDLGTEGRELAADELRGLVPHLDPGGAPTFFFPHDGRIDISALIDGFAAGARAAGAEIATGTEVRELLVEGGRVIGARCADGAHWTADVTVLAAGAWAGALGRAAGSRVELRPTRRHLLVTAAADAVDPSWPVIWIERGGFYARPESGGLLLSGCDLVDVDPDDCPADSGVRELIAEKTARYLPAFADAGAAHFWCGLRTLTTDDRFAIGSDPDVEGLFWVAGLGGHGMGAGAEVGRIAAALLDGEDEPLAAPLDPGRLRAEAAQL